MNVDSFPPFVVGLAGLGVVGFVAWTISSCVQNRIELHKLELKISSDYVKRDAFDELRHELKTMSALMYEIAGKLGIPIRRE